MNLVRGITIFLTQLTILYYISGSMDLLFGFNQTDKGIGTVMALFVLTPLLNLSWLVAEIDRSTKIFGRGKRLATALMPVVAFIFFSESLAIDFYVLSQLRM